MVAGIRWLSTCMLILLLLVGTSISTAQVANQGVFSIAAGDVDQTTAVLWAYSAEIGSLTFEIATDERFTVIMDVQSTEVIDPMLPVKIEVRGLLPHTHYYYRVTNPVGERRIGTFRTTAPLGEHAGLRFGVTGDWQQQVAPYLAIKNVPERQLDFMVLHGDTIYADNASPAVPLKIARTEADFRAKHLEALSPRLGLNTWADTRSSTAIYAMIDDHEVIDDFAGGAPTSSDQRFDQHGKYLNETDLYQHGLRAFFDYMPIREEAYAQTETELFAGKPKLYRARNFGSDAALFLVDARSFRDQPLRQLPFADINDADKVKAYLAETYAPGRSLLGVAQFELLKADLLKAQQDGILWKFVLVPEPIQNFGALNAPDRYEGYAAERAALLDFILSQRIENVVFITADFHCMAVNNIFQRKTADSPLMPTTMWEIITGPVAVDPPFGPQLFQLVESNKLLTPAQIALYKLLPMAGQDKVLMAILSAQLNRAGYDDIGLQDSDIDATLIKGDYVAMHAYTWTEFDIDAVTGNLLVSTYGVPWYSQQTLAKTPNTVTAYTPELISQFSVRPQ